jgi:hypothetical protein
MRRASWQHRAGLINDERTTLRQVVRIIELEKGKHDLRLIEPLTKLGQSFFYLDVSGANSYPGAPVATGEVYLKRALRIATENPSSDWKQVAETGLVLGDYYMIGGSDQRARKIYQETWRMLTEDEDRFDYRREQLERLVPLRHRPIPQYVQSQSEALKSMGDPEVQFIQGNITVTYDISINGRATNLKIIEAVPADFTNMQRSVQRELRTRVYRPRFVESQPAISDKQILVHRFFYTQADLDAIRSTSASMEQNET